MYDPQECTQYDIDILKQQNELDLDWKYIDNTVTEETMFYTLKFLMNQQIIAVMTFSYVCQIAAIDEFEVVKSKRKQGHGMQIINEFVSGFDENISLLAKNKEVQKFWEKCGFVLDYESQDEIPMTYYKCGVKSTS